MTSEERERLGTALIDSVNEMCKFSCDTQEYKDVSKAVTALSNAITDSDNREYQIALKERELELKERELEVNESKIVNEKKHGLISMIVDGLIKVAGIAAPIAAMLYITKKESKVAETDIPSKNLSKASDSSRNEAFKIKKF